MQISTRYSMALHTLLCVEVFRPTRKVTSEFVAGSVHTNPVVIRKLMLQLRDAGLIEIAKGPGGISFTKALESITLLDVYRAVEPDKEGRLFRMHADPEPQCPVGGHIDTLLTGYFVDAQSALETELSRTSLSSLLEHLRILQARPKT